jgi:hypothetical protein
MTPKTSSAVSSLRNVDSTPFVLVSRADRSSLPATTVANNTSLRQMQSNGAQAIGSGVIIGRVLTPCCDEAGISDFEG